MRTELRNSRGIVSAGYTACLLGLSASIVSASPSAPGIRPADTETIIHNFTEKHGDGAFPFGRLMPGGKGVVYGTTAGGGICGGTVFDLIPDGLGSYYYATIFDFDCGGKGGVPYSGPISDAKGALYGTTSIGGTSGYGVVYKLVHHKGMTEGWKETILYSFTGGSDGATPAGNPIIDASGNLYGTTTVGGSYSGNCQTSGCGVVYKLSKGSSGYTQSVLYTFTGGSDGTNPTWELLPGANGVLYGMTAGGGANGAGTVFELVPGQSGYTLNTVYSFSGGSDGGGPTGGLVADANGALYGVTSGGGTYGQGVIYKLASGVESVLYNFTGGSDGGFPQGTLAVDSKGNLYGTTEQGGLNNCSGLLGCGGVFELKPGTSGKYKETTLYSFAGSPDGFVPTNGVALGSNHSVLGTTYYGNSTNCQPYDGGCGIVFALTH